MNKPFNIKCVFLGLLFACIYLHADAQLTANFSASSLKGCSPLTVQFRDLSAGGPTQWYWDFGNGTTSSQQNPLVIYPVGGTYTIRLIVRNSSAQDYEEKINYITVFSTPIAEFSVTPDSGCAPLQVTFTETSGNPDIKSWLWNFGDGNTSNQQNPVHTYNTIGKFDVSLTVQTLQGCTATQTSYNGVIAGNQPQAKFTASPLDGCGSALRYFTNLSTGNITSSFWSFGDGGKSADQNPIYHYKDTGLFSVRLVAGENGCTDSAEIKKYVHVEAPIAIIKKIVNCDDRFTVKFIDGSIGEKSRKWDFGDGSFSTARSVLHVFKQPGVYVIKLHVYSDTCSDTVLDTINVTNKKPSLNILPQKSLYCKGDSIQFFISDYDSAFARVLAWDFDDGTLIDFRRNFDTVSHAYLKASQYKPVAIFKEQSCIDTLTLNSPIQVTGPIANFKSVPSPGCIQMPVNFTDESIAYPGAPIQKWIWDYGDGIVQNFSSPPFSYTYSFPLSYNVGLSVIDLNNCMDTVHHLLRILQPPKVQAGSDTLICDGQTIQLNATGALDYLWNNSADLSCTTCNNPVAQPHASTVYYVTGTDAGGCSATDSVAINVQLKQYLSMQPTPFVICSGDSAQLHASGVDIYSWQPVSGLNNAAVADPFAFPAATTTYTVTGSDSNNCFTDTASAEVVVNPKPHVNIKDSIVTIASGATYLLQEISSDDVNAWQWLPPTGLSCTNCPQPVATLKNNISYTLKVSNALGCSGTDQIAFITLCTKDIIYIPNTFSPNLDGVNDYFFPRANADVSIKSLRIYNRWGQIVFEKINFPANCSSCGWDGKHGNKEQSSDVYVYIMDLQCANGIIMQRKGDITLVR